MRQTVYFSVDVETTGPIPGTYDLLSIGIDTIGADGERFYATIDNGPTLRWHPETLDWWRQQDPDVFAEALHAERSPRKVASALARFVEDVAPDPATRCFVASPVAFDWPFVNHLLLTELGYNPFGHRALCIRSMLYGLAPGIEWNADRSTWRRYAVESERPHNALHDAIAQRKQLERLLADRDRRTP